MTTSNSYAALQHVPTVPSCPQVGNAVGRSPGTGTDGDDRLMENLILDALLPNAEVQSVSDETFPGTLPG